MVYVLLIYVQGNYICNVIKFCWEGKDTTDQSTSVNLSVIYRYVQYYILSTFSAFLFLHNLNLSSAIGTLGRCLSHED
jgi:hypothetical protein